MTPVLCDVNGDKNLEILAMTNGGYFNDPATQGPNGILFALSASGEILDRFDLGSPRFWGFAFVANADDDPYLELVVCGSGGLDVIQTRGYGPNTEHFQRRRTYQRLNVVPWAYEDSCFIYRGQKENVENLTDNLVLARDGDVFRPKGRFVTELLSLPPGCLFDRLEYQAHVTTGAGLEVNILAPSGKPLAKDVPSGARPKIAEPVQLEFLLTTSDGSASPKLDSYQLSFHSEDKESEQ
jgi:hypothetical protein